MKVIFNNFPASIAIILSTLMLSITGCEPSKKPMPAPPAPGSRIIEVRPYPAGNQAITPEENNGLNNRLSHTANNIKGIKNASVLVIGTSAYVGFYTDSGVDKSRLEAIRQEIAAAIKEAEPRITSVWTATNPTTVDRINKVRADIRAKKTASAYSSNVRSILNESKLVR